MAAVDPVLEWNTASLNAIHVSSPAPSTPAAARLLAIPQIAVYDAVNAIEHGGYRGYLYNHPAPRITSVTAAVDQAAHDTLVALFPAQAATFDTELATDLAAIPEGRGKQLGIELGKTTARLILVNRSNDGSNAPEVYTIKSGPGQWQPTPPAFRQVPLSPQWPGVKPFIVLSNDQFGAPPPPALDSARYTQDFNEVKSIGAADSTTRTADQAAAAVFWQDGAIAWSGAGHWNKIAQELSIQRGLTVAQNARLFALLDIALADAGLTCWTSKYKWNLWRPVTAIRAADTDGNPDTTADPTWTPLIATPPFPTYTSGHAAMSGAASTILASFFGTDNISFTTLAADLPQLPVRSFTSLSGAAFEAARSRVWGGFHFWFDSEEALKEGQQVAQWTLTHALTRGGGDGGGEAQGGGDQGQDQGGDGQGENGNAIANAAVHDVAPQLSFGGSSFSVLSINDRKATDVLS
jgi:hypothetical protein